VAPKRHFRIDCRGSLLTVSVTGGRVQDRDAGIDLIRPVWALFFGFVSSVPTTRHSHSIVPGGLLVMS
jgi:hypothetical protein